MGLVAVWQKFYKTLAALRTGVILLLLVGILAAVGTFILQRPTSEPGQLERVYSPTTLALLDRVGLTDVFHSWYFLSLLALVSISIIFASLERWPNAWRFYARPYRRPEAHFRAVLPHHNEFAVGDARAGIEAAERGFRKVGLAPERIVDSDAVSLYAERNRFSVLAVYIIHLSLLVIAAGYMIDGLVGYRGYMAIDEGSSNNVIEVMGSNAKKQLPFSVRCDAAGQENYKDSMNRDTGMPKKYWSKLTVIDKGAPAMSKEIVVNDPMVYAGIRMFQSSMGQSGKLKFVDLKIQSATGDTKDAELSVGQSVDVAPDTKITLRRFVPDAYMQDNEVFTKSESPDNPAIQLVVNKAGQESTGWVFASAQGGTEIPNTGYRVAIAGGKLANFTGLQISYEPGHRLVWLGTVLMVIGLAVAFYMVHMRFWAIVVNDERKGLVLWVGGAFNKNKERFEDRYKSLTDAIRAELPPMGPTPDELLEQTRNNKEGARNTTVVGA